MTFMLAHWYKNSILQMYTFNTHKTETQGTMPRSPVKSNQRLSIRIDASQKELLMRAASIQCTDLTEFVTRSSVSAAYAIIEQHEHLILSEQETSYLLNLLDAPPVPNEKLMAAAAVLPARQ
jgi:uncharacterized protein (DUF1778 family)